MRLRNLDERKEFDEELSLRYCNEHFGAYGAFATLPLETALLATDDRYFTATFHPVFHGSIAMRETERGVPNTSKDLGSKIPISLLLTNTVFCSSLLTG
jgi:hypothetical protein